jgi:hypothetical protein
MSHNAGVRLSDVTIMLVTCYNAAAGRYIVEMEVVLPADMTVKDSHDISLELQHKVGHTVRRYKSSVPCFQ